MTTERLPCDGMRGRYTLLVFRRKGFVVALALTSLALDPWLGAASAQDGGMASCEPPSSFQPQEVTPADSARQVSIDAPVRVRYSPGYFGAGGPGGDPSTLITVFRCPDDGCTFPCRFEDAQLENFVSGRVQVLGDNLFFYPEDQWEPGQAYTGLAKGEDSELPFSFCTGTTTDRTPPNLREIADVTSTAVEPRCDAPEGGYRIAAFFPPADDAGGPPASIEYLLFQTRGAGIEEPVLRSTIRNFATEMHTMAFVLPPSEATEPICVRVAAVDGNGNLDWSNSRADVDCIDPVQGDFFQPLCVASAIGAGRAPAFGFALFGLVALALVIRRR